MSKETEAIKAVAMVAEQAYREVFHVDDTATTTELNVLADAIAALDKPTPAPEPPKCICELWGDLHDPRCPAGKPKPDPTIWHDPEAGQPKPLKAETCACGHRWGDHAFYDGPCIHQCGCKRYSAIQSEAKLPKANQPDHNCPDNCVSESSKCPDVGWFEADNLLPMCPNYTPPKTECPSQPESILPAAVLATFDGLERDIMRDIVDCDDEDRAEAARMFSLAKQRLAALQPAVREITEQEIINLLKGEWVETEIAQSTYRVLSFKDAVNLAKKLSAKLGQPQPAVTAEKPDTMLQEAELTATTKELMMADIISRVIYGPSAGRNRRTVEAAQAVLKAFPTLGSGRLTRERLVKMFTEVAHQKKAESELLAGDVLHLIEKENL